MTERNRDEGERREKTEHDEKLRPRVFPGRPHASHSVVYQPHGLGEESTVVENSTASELVERAGEEE